MAPRVYVGRLDYRVHGRDLDDLFSPYGRIREILIKNGYAFVEFESTRDAEHAVDRLHNTRFMGERIIVEFAKERPRYPLWRGYERHRARSPLPNMSHRRRRSFSRSPLRVSRRQESRSPRRDNSASDGPISRDGRSLRSPRRDSRERSRSSQRGQKSPSRERSLPKSPVLYSRSTTPQEEGLPGLRIPDGSPYHNRCDDPDQYAPPGYNEELDQIPSSSNH